MQRNLLVDGYVAYTFRPPGAMVYLSRLLLGVTADRLKPVFNQRSILVPRACLFCEFREARDSQELVLLDYVVDPTIGTVVPQKLSQLAGAGERQKLQTPIFFTQPDGSLGITLLEAVNSSRDGSLSLHHNQHNENAILTLNVGRL